MNNGYIYENKVIETLIQAGMVGTILEGAGASAADADADMIINGQRHLIEIKEQACVQMGGTSIKFIEDVFSFTKEVDPIIQKAMLAAAETKREAINNFMDFVDCSQFPVRCSLENWNNAKQNGLLKEINKKVRFHDVSFIVDHYNSKGVNYIQIGDCGLFYLGTNPANLPIPPLQGEINLEFRAGRSKAVNNIVGAGLRVQARLQFQTKSPVSLDSLETITRLW